VYRDSSELRERVSNRVTVRCSSCFRMQTTKISVLLSTPSSGTPLHFLELYLMTEHEVAL
jgi:hypothetical protein